jgi:hypothetical protein
VRLIFDTQYFRRLGPALLRELRQRGFVLSISSSAFMETWSRALEDDRPGLFFGPARKFAPYVDPDYPVAAAAGDLRVRLGARSPRLRVTPARYLETTLVSWKHATTSNSGNPFYRQQGAKVQRDLARRKADWLQLARSWKVVDPRGGFEQQAKNLKFLRSVDRKRLDREMWRYLIQCYAPQGIRPPLPPERFNGYMKVTATYLLEVGQDAQTATGNDDQDILQLMHVGEPAIFVTHERKILNAVDNCGTFQAPWVRTLAEVLTERLPKENPWGRHARRLRARFRRRSYDELREAEQRLLGQLPDLRAPAS